MNVTVLCPALAVDRQDHPEMATSRYSKPLQLVAIAKQSAALVLVGLLCLEFFKQEIDAVEASNGQRTELVQNAL